ncbi:LPXTG-motif cell wall-anchored protein [Lacibacter cauensis]|uniref:LPXTG-motif cell wall-anchored protein n=1 Tax=Lacibacter cauensis TaxID=510947 RepID=A0A562SJ67_9BACT|nr:LPXTG-motif cell wall-anchored protein [Lacibacter cauensis]
MNWPVLIIVGIALLLLIVFLVRRNQKDEQEFEQQLNNDYHKTKDEEGDVETDNSLR